MSAEEISFGAVKSLESLKYSPIRKGLSHTAFRESDVQVLYYDSRIQLRVSDHKPVTALLRVDLGKVVIPIGTCATPENKIKIISQFLEIDQNQKQPASVKSLPVVSKKVSQFQVHEGPHPPSPFFFGRQDI